MEHPHLPDSLKAFGWPGAEGRTRPRPGMLVLAAPDRQNRGSTLRIRSRRQTRRPGPASFPGTTGRHGREPGPGTSGCVPNAGGRSAPCRLSRFGEGCAGCIVAGVPSEAWVPELSQTARTGIFSSSPALRRPAAQLASLETSFQSPGDSRDALSSPCALPSGLARPVLYFQCDLAQRTFREQEPGQFGRRYAPQSSGRNQPFWLLLPGTGARARFWRARGWALPWVAQPRPGVD